MGYSYDQDGHLCCDVCDHSGGVRKHKCPWNWCQAIALCPQCRVAERYLLTNEYHRGRGCEKFGKEFRALALERHSLLTGGQCVRCAALRHYDQVKVIFRGQRSEFAYLMEPSTYYAIPLLVNATPEDYAKIGTIRRAQNTDLHDPV